MDKEEALYKIARCLSLRDYTSIKAWLERAHKSSQPKAFDDITLEVAALFDHSDGIDAAHPVVVEIRDQASQIKKRIAEEVAEINRLRAAIEEDKRKVTEKKRREEEEQRILEAVSYLNSIQISYSDIKREDLPAYARTRKIELIKATKEAEAKAAQERFEEDQFRHLENKHKSFLLRKGLDTDIRVLISVKTPNRRRITHCYACRSHLDEALHLNCSECRWIVCPSCGSCGCGYQK